MRLHLCAIGIAALALGACATQVPRPGTVVLRYMSQPAGAQVVRDGVVLGRTPLAHPEPVNWTRADGRDVATCTSQKPVTFLWDSGATSTVEYPCREYPVAVAVRPEDAPGLDRDLLAEEQVSRRTPSSSRVGRLVPTYSFNIMVPRITSGFANDPNSWIHEPARGMVSGIGLGVTEAPRFY
jgi:hypothetical protein